PADGERWLADLQTLLGPESTALYPQRESLGAEEPHYELAGERIETLEALLRGAVRVLVTTARASAERTAVPAALEQARVVIEVSKEERSLTDTALRPTDTIVITDQESAVEREVERAWADAAHHLEVARRMGEEPPAREDLLIDPGAWRARLNGLARIAVSDAETEQRFPLAPPEH